MRGSVNLPAKNILKQICSQRGTWRALSVSAPERNEKKELGTAGLVVNDNAEPIAAFSKTPPLPPVLGPLFVLSLLEMGSSSDGSEN